MISVLVATLLSVGFVGSAAHADGFSMTPFLTKCGGKIYSKCDSTDFNQETIFEVARSQAIAEGKQLMVVIGADWCPACRWFSEMLDKDQDASKLYDRFVLVKLNGDLKSTKTLAAKLAFSYLGIPNAFVMAPGKNEVTQRFYPTRYSSVDELLATIGVVNTIQVVQASHIGNLPVSSLEKPIVLSFDYGVSHFNDHAKTLAERYTIQGVSALQVYHYLDAYRSFTDASRLDPDFVMAYVGQALSVLQLESSSEALGLADSALKKIEDRAMRKPLDPVEQAWADFARSYVTASKSNVLQSSDHKTKTLRESILEIQSKDPNNYDGLSLVVWLGLSAFDTDQAKKIFENVLKHQPDNIGAHHSLLHIAESENDAATAQKHAMEMARLAPRSAHAQHMYGHTLPGQGKWAEALEYFKKADRIHMEWSANNGLEPTQDWHYAHNLDLMGAAYLGLGEFDKAKEIWLKITSTDVRLTRHFMELIVATSQPAEADAILSSYEKAGWQSAFAQLRKELEITPENAKTVQFETQDAERGGFPKLLQKILDVYSDRIQDSKLNDEIVGYISDQFKKGGYDGWSNAYLEMLRFKRVARILGMKSLLGALEPLEFAVKGGGLCSSKTPQTQLIKCIQ